MPRRNRPARIRRAQRTKPRTLATALAPYTLSTATALSLAASKR